GDPLGEGLGVGLAPTPTPDINEKVNTATSTAAPLDTLASSTHPPFFTPTQHRVKPLVNGAGVLAAIDRLGDFEN
ncbi:MAG TPA: hypothetical protein VIG64_02690, partial [Actinomycetota bacterium]